MTDTFVIIITTTGTDLRLKTVYNSTSPVTCKLLQFKLLQFKLHTSAQLQVTSSFVSARPTKQYYIFFQVKQPASLPAHCALVYERVPWLYI